MLAGAASTDILLDNIQKPTFLQLQCFRQLLAQINISFNSFFSFYQIIWLKYIETKFPLQ